MNRVAAIAGLLLVVPAVLLASLAWQAAERDADDARGALAESLTQECAALERRIEAALRDAHDEARVVAGSKDFLSYAPALFFRAGERLGFEPPGADMAISDDDARLYRLAVAGGESWEHEHSQPELAIDAYSFWLARLTSEELRARLRFRIARAALAAGRERLAAAIADDLIENEASRANDDGWPLAWLAARLLERIEADSETDPDSDSEADTETAPDPQARLAPRSPCAGPHACARG